jgi:hypothetical protein
MVICVLNEPGRLHDVLAAFLEAGVRSSTVIESQGMGRILSHDVPLFAGFRQMFQGSKPYNHTIFAVVNGREVAEEIVTLVRDVLEDMKDPHKGIIFTVPVGLFEHLSKE